MNIFVIFNRLYFLLGSLQMGSLPMLFLNSEKASAHK